MYVRCVACVRGMVTPIAYYIMRTRVMVTPSTVYRVS